MTERVHRLVAEFCLLGNIEQGRLELRGRFDGRLERHLQGVANRQALGHPSAHGIEAAIGLVEGGAQPCGRIGAVDRRADAAERLGDRLYRSADAFDQADDQLGDEVAKAALIYLWRWYGSCAFGTEQPFTFDQPIAVIFWLRVRPKAGVPFL